jgi:hypothetical protein
MRGIVASVTRTTMMVAGITMPGTPAQVMKH